MFHKYPKIKTLGDEENKELLQNPEDEIIIEEKIDGGNFRFFCKEGKITFGSRTQELDENNKNSNNFLRCINFVKEKLEGKQLPNNMIFYGECCVLHSLHYDWDKIPPFLGFDILKTNNENQPDCFLNYDEKITVFNSLDLPTVPLIKRCKAKEIKKITDEDIPKSAYSENFAEGIVFKNYQRRISAKYVSDKFKEVNRKTFGQSKKWAETDDDRIVAMFCTNPRIDKIIFKLIDKGEKLEMKMMEKLPTQVIEDIYEEHWRDICFSKWSINFQKIRKKITNRCKNVLLQVMVNNSLNKESTNRDDKNV